MELLALQAPCTMSGEEAVAALDALHAEDAARKTYRLEVLARLDETGHTKEISGQDTARFVAERHRLNRPEVQRDLKLGKALPKYPVVVAALPVPHVSVGPDPTVHHTDADTDVTAVPDEAGGTTLSGDEMPVLLHPDQAEAIVSALEAVPPAAMVPVENLQAAEEQLVEAARNLSSWDLKKLGKRVRDVLDTDGPEPKEEAARRREALRLTNADHGVKISGFLANENAELLKATIEAAAKPRMTLEGERDPRSLEKRQADALSDVLAVAAGAGELPGHGGIKPHITVTIDYDDLLEKGRDATGDLHFGERLSASAVRRLACDAEIIPVVLGSESEPLDVGRGQRYVTKAMWRALVRRDKGCVVCGMPPRYSHAHHVVHWIDGGPTSVANLVFLCSVHHSAVHAGQYTITIANGKVHVTRPAWADPPRTTAHPARTSTYRPAKAVASLPSWATTPSAVSRPTATTTPRASGVATSHPGGTNTSRAGGSNTSRADGSNTSRADGSNTSRSGGSTASVSAWASTPGATAASPAGQGDLVDGERGVGGFGTGNDPFWGEGPPEPALRPARAFPMSGDPPPLTAARPPDFDPWSPETLDTG